MTTEPTIPLESPAAASLDPSLPGAASSAAKHPAPRIRWAGIVWGSFFAVLATVALGQLADASRRAAIHDWLLTLTPNTFSPGVVIGFVVLGVGLLLLIAGGVALLRRAQVRATIEP